MWERTCGPYLLQPFVSLHRIYPPREVADERGVWSTPSSLPAVRNNWTYVLSGGYLVVPGPRLVDATEAFACALHPEVFR